MWLLFLIVAALAFLGYRSATTTTVVLVRHAEKELGTIEDPPLTAAGEQRAERLAQMLGSVRGAGALDAIYVPKLRRAQQTALPLAMRLGLQPTVIPGRDIDALVSRILREHRGGRVLVVGQSTTLPKIVKRLSDMTIPPIADDEYDDLYVVTVPSIGRASVLRMKY